MCIFAGMKQEITIKNIEDLDRAAKEFLEKIGEHTLVAFFAPMGSGKTTFIKTVAGLLTADGGSVTVDGHKIGVESKALVAYLPERNSIPEHFTVGEAVEFYKEFFLDFDEKRADDMLQARQIVQYQR